MAAVCVNVIFIKLVNTVFDDLEDGDVNMQSFLICSLGHEDNSRDTDEEFLDLNCCDELDMLATGLESG